MSDFDLDAAVAAREEASGDAHKVIWGGETFAIPPSTSWPIETFDVLGQGEVAAALAGVLGDQWEAFYSARKPSLAAAWALLDGIAEKEGHAGVGEWQASSPSLNRAMRRSRPTSSAYTGSTS